MDIPITKSYHYYYDYYYYLLVDMGLKRGIILCVPIILAITISSISLVFLVGWHGFHKTNQGKHNLKHRKGLKVS